MNETCRKIAIDLTPMKAGGANGGIKPLIIEALRLVSRQLGSSAQYVFFTNSQTHHEITKLANYKDTLICILPEPEFPHKRAYTIYRELTGDQKDPRILIDHSIDILYCPFGATTLACPGIPVVSCIVDLLHKDFPASLPQQEIGHREAYFQQTIKVSDSLNCISQYVIGRLKECYPDYLGEFFHTYNTIQDRFSRITAISAGIPAKPYFFYPANYWTHKNHEGLLIGYQIYLNKTPNSSRDLVLTGHEDERTKEIKQLAQSLGIENKVRFLGHVSESQLKTIWENSFALVFPSLHEGFGIPLLEAMHFGKPTICSDSCCLPEIGGDAMLYVNARRPEEIAQAMLKLENNKELQKQLSQKAKVRIKDFNFEHEIQKLSSSLLSIKQTRRWYKNIHNDGRFNELALLSIPNTPGRKKLSLELSSPEELTLVAIYLGKLPLGTHRLQNRTIQKIEFWLLDPVGCLRLDIKIPVSYKKTTGTAVFTRIHSITITSESGKIDFLYGF